MILMTAVHMVGAGIVVLVVDALCFTSALTAKWSIDRELNRADS